MTREIKNTKTIEHMSSNGTTFKADRGDLVGGVNITYAWEITEEQKLADFIEFGAWHAMWIHPDLNRFGGYDNIKLGLVT
jgi:hypothetical protein